MPENELSSAPLQSSVAKIFAGYKGGEEMPLASYAATVGVFNAAFAALLLAAKNSGRPLPERIGYGDLVLLGVATHKLSRIITKDRVTSPLRAPFTEYEGAADASEVKEKVRGTGMQRAIGDLITCPWCMGTWVAAGLVLGFVFKPRVTRVVGSVLVAATISDLLNHGHEAIKEKG